MFMKDTIQETLSQMREMEAKSPPRQIARGEYKIDAKLGDRLWQDSLNDKKP